MRTFTGGLVGLALAVGLSCGTLSAQDMNTNNAPTASNSGETAIFGAGCFWCVEAVFEQIPGVRKVESGYCGGHTENPTYEEVCRGRTGHAEVIRLEFDPAIVSYDQLLDVFWDAHDPTQLNRQGNDVGTQYRSAIFYTSVAQREAAVASRDRLNKSGRLGQPVVTQIEPAGTFYKAEDYHQGYYEANRSQPYCRFVIRPKLEKMGLRP